MAKRSAEDPMNSSPKRLTPSASAFNIDETLLGAGVTNSDAMADATPVPVEPPQPELSSSVPPGMKASHARGFIPPYQLGPYFKTIKSLKSESQNDELGKGSYGVVVSATTEKNWPPHRPLARAGEKVAIKKITEVFENTTQARRILREIKILRLLNKQGHPNIVGLRGLLPIDPKTFATFQELYIVFEFVDTDIEKVMDPHRQPAYRLQEDHVKYFMFQMLHGLRYMHNRSILHRDLKPGNLLVNENCSLKLCDFGLSRCIYQPAQNAILQRRPSEASGSQSAAAAGGGGALGAIPAPQPMQRTASIGSALPPLPVAQRAPGAAAVVAMQDVPAVPPPLPLVRQLTKHVATRYYRAPELILTADNKAPESNYTSSIDMWSAGCVFAELLGMMDDKHARRQIFPGKSCFPLTITAPEQYKDPRDQLNMIFDVIGTPGEDEIAQIKSVHSQAYLRGLKQKKPQSLSNLYSHASPSALQLLQDLLTFDPSRRLTAAEALEKPWFTGAVYPPEAACLIPDGEFFDDKPEPIEKGYFAFEEEHLSLDQLRVLILKEVALDNPHLQAAVDEFAAKYSSSRKGGYRSPVRN